MVNKNAKILNVKLCNNSYNAITLEIEMALGNNLHCVFGGIKLADIDETFNAYAPAGNYCGYYLSRIFNVVGVNNLNDLNGQAVRAIFKNDGNGGDLCIGIMNFIDDNNFFIPREDFNNK